MKILLAVDGSPYSDAAVEEVARRPWPPQSEIRVVTVDAPIDPSFLRAGPTIYDDLIQRLRDEARSQLSNVVQRLREKSTDLNVSSELLIGSPHEKILDEAIRWGADLIVVGSQGKGILKSVFLGSVSLAVVLYAPCSVEIVRKAKDTPADQPSDGS